VIAAPKKPIILRSNHQKILIGNLYRESMFSAGIRSGRPRFSIAAFGVMRESKRSGNISFAASWVELGSQRLLATIERKREWLTKLISC
jgi:hypothetical protein